MSLIPLDKALNLLATPDKNGRLMPAKITVIECDLERNTGGKRIVYDKAVLSSPGNGKKRYHTRNDVRRIKLLPSGEYRSFHPLLLTHINGHEVCL